MWTTDITCCWKTYADKNTFPAQLPTQQLCGWSFLDVITINHGQESEATKVSQCRRDSSAGVLQHLSISCHETIKRALVDTGLAAAGELDEFIVAGLGKGVGVAVHRWEVRARSDNLTMAQ